MRIIAGDYKGRVLCSPGDRRVRPTSDKVKEALFSIIGYKIIDSVCMDLFAGTGNLGLEALSRGAKKCYFADHSGESIKIIKENIKICRGEDYSVVIHGDYKKVLSNVSEKMDIIFLDPPYEKDMFEDIMIHIRENDILSEKGFLVCEHSNDVAMPEEISGYCKTKERRYGKVVLSFYM